MPFHSRKFRSPTICKVNRRRTIDTALIHIQIVRQITWDEVGKTEGDLQQLAGTHCSREFGAPHQYTDTSTTRFCWFTVDRHPTRFQRTSRLPDITRHIFLEASNQTSARTRLPYEVGGQRCPCRDISFPVCRGLTERINEETRESSLVIWPSSISTALSSAAPVWLQTAALNLRNRYVSHITGNPNKNPSLRANPTAVSPNVVSCAALSTLLAYILELQEDYHRHTGNNRLCKEIAELEP